MAKESKVIYYLQGLSIKERQLLAEWLPSPLGANSPLFGRILAVLERDLESGAKALDFEDFFTAIYPGKPFNLNYLHRILSGFLAALFRFIGWREYESSVSLQQHCLLKGINTRKQTRYFQDVYQRNARQNRKLGEQHDRYLYQMLADREFRTQKVAQFKKQDDLNLSSVLNSLDEYFILSKLIYACAALNQDQILGTKHEIRFIEVILNQIGQDLTAYSPLIQGYYLAYLGLKEGKDKRVLEQLLTLLENAEVKFSNDGVKDLYQLAHNICSRRINLGDRSFDRTLSRIVRNQVEGKFLQVNGYLPLLLLRNLMTLIVKLEGVKPAQVLLENTIPQLRPEYQEMAYDYHLAVLDFNAEKFRECRTQLMQHFHQFKTDNYILGARRYLCMCYLELGEWDNLARELEAFRKTLGRSAPSTARSSYKLFTNRLGKLMRIVIGNPDGRENKLLTYQQAIKKEARSLRMSWLLYKVKDLLNKG